MSDIALLAPFAAWVSPLSEVPDEAFAGGMLGDGLTLDPLEGVVRAPLDAEVIAVAQTGHSVTLRHASGAEILIHVGIDTVELKGEGFKPLAIVGSNVRVGEDLIHFDLDLVARNAKSVMTPLVLLGDDFRVADFASGLEVSAGQPVAVIRKARGQDAAGTGPSTGETAQRRLRVQLVNGVHARPAAHIAAALKPYAADVRIGVADREGNARSVTSLLKLDIRHGDEIRLDARGPDAAAAVEAVAARILHDRAENSAPQMPPPLPGGHHLRQDEREPGTIAGVRAAPGGGLGIAVQLREQDLPIIERGGPPAEERAALVAAVDILRLRLIALSRDSDVAEAHLAILDDPEFRQAIDLRIDDGLSAAAAWRAVTRDEVATLKASGNSLLAERAADLIDVERQLVAILSGESARKIDLPDNAIVLADDLMPSTFLSFERSRLAGIATAFGGPTSHVAILAASRGIPMLVSCGHGLLDLANDTKLIIEADRPLLRVDPDEAEIDRMRSRTERLKARAEAEAAAAKDDCYTADGKRVEVFANCGSLDDAELAAQNGAEGCGLLRTEFLFLDRKQAPTSEEQMESYARIARALSGRPLLVRTLDAGSDKVLSYLPLAAEENPALGMRGIRLLLAHPEILEPQLLAILKAVPGGQRRIMLPMVTDLSELRAVRGVLSRLEADLGIADPTPLGIMVETPAAAILAEQLAREADFLSIGSNDLTQYALAADRQNAAVGGTTDPLHPAVLGLIKLAAEGAHAHGRWLGVCGGVASDPAAAAILIGLGADELSVTPPMVPAIKARVRTLQVDACRRLAEAALNESTAAEVRLLIEGEADAPAL